MGLKDTIADEVKTILDWSFSISEEGARVPRKEDLTLGKTAIQLSTCVLYVDMRNSSTFADSHRRTTSAKVYNAYLNAMVRVAKGHGGEVRSFNGDSVLVFFNPSQSTVIDIAVVTARKMQWVARHMLEPAIRTKGYEQQFQIGVGVTWGTLLVTKAGLRGDPNNSDLIWPCTAVNLAAKLGDRARGEWPIYISKEVYERLSDDLKYAYPKAVFFRGGLWDQCTVDFAGKSVTAYRSSVLAKVE